MNARSSMILSGRSRSDSKALPPSLRLAGFAGTLDDQLVDQRALSLAGTQEPPHALEVLPLAQASGHHDPDLRVGDVDPLVEHLRRDERPQRARLKSGQRLLPLGAPDVAGERHD